MIKILLVFVIVGCAQQPSVWRCMADIERNSKCQIIDCKDIGTICKQKDYRVLTVYPTKSVYVYSTNPLTDLEICEGK